MEMLRSWSMTATSSAWLIAARQRVLRIWRGTGYGMVLDELDLFRDRGMRILVLIGWASTAAMAILGWLAGNVMTIAVVALSAATTVLPTLLLLRKRHDRVARLLTGSMAVIHPALALYLLHGEGWSAYASMYSFVALASLIVLCDWRPIAIATILTVTHHVTASARQIGGDRPDAEILIHALALTLQAVVLCYVTAQLRALMTHQHKARIESDRLASLAIDARGELEAALAQSIAVERREAIEREQRRTATSVLKPSVARSGCASPRDSRRRWRTSRDRSDRHQQSWTGRRAR